MSYMQQRCVALRVNYDDVTNEIFILQEGFAPPDEVEGGSGELDEY